MSNKRTLVKKLAKNTLLTQKECEQVLTKLFEIIEEEVLETGEVKIVGFGKFFLYEHTPRPVINPLTKEEMILKKFNSIKFKPSALMKQRVKDQTEE
jgi:DNA-binding protein HU-beta